jgi:hypothetical protein
MPVKRPPKTGCKWSNKANSSSSVTPFKGSNGSSRESTNRAFDTNVSGSTPSFPLFLNAEDRWNSVLATAASGQKLLSARSWAFSKAVLMYHLFRVRVVVKTWV